MSEEATLDKFTGGIEKIFSAKPEGVRLALDESYPDEWEFAELADVCEVNSGFTWNKEQETDSSKDGAVPVIKIGNVQDGYLDLADILYLADVSDKDLQENKARKDWLLMIGSNGSGERVGHCGIIEEDMEFVYASFLYGLHADSKHLLPRFLFYSLNRPKVQQRLTSFTAGSTSLKNLNKATIENLSIPTPPLSEQRKIATVLYTVDRAIEKTGEIIERVDRIKKGFKQDVFAEGYFDHQSHQESQVGKIPESWRVEQAADLCDGITVGVVTGATDSYVTPSEGVPFIRSQDVHENYIDQESLKYISKDFHEQQSSSELREGNVITVRTGEPGTSCVIPPELDGANCFSLIISRPKEEVNDRFYSYYINSEKALGFIDSWKAGGVQDNFNVGVMERLPVPVPTAEEQQAIVDSLDDINERLESERQYRNRLQRLKRGLMQDLLSGTVRTTDADIDVPDEIARHG